MITYRIGDTLPQDQAEWLYGLLGSGLFYGNVAPDLDAIHALEQIGTSGYRVTVATERPTAVAEPTIQWLDTWQVAREGTDVVGTGGKRQLLAQYGPDRPAVLIDDDPAKALTIARAGVQVWSPRRPWTPANWDRYSNYWVFPDWDAALQRLGADTTGKAA
jgi:hypothetical protein